MAITLDADLESTQYDTIGTFNLLDGDHDFGDCEIK